MKTKCIFSFILLSGALSGVFADSPAVSRNVLDVPAKDVPAKTELLLEAFPKEGGTVSGGGVYRTADATIIRAMASKGFIFVRWEGAQIQNASYPVTQVLCGGGKRLIKAVFEPQPVKVSVNIMPASMGTVSGAGILRWGDRPQLVATPQKGCVFVGWDGPVREKDKPQTTLEKPLEAPVSLTARFKYLARSQSLEIACEPAGAGAVKGAGAYARGTRVPVSAEPAMDFVFSHWKGDSVADKGMPSTTVFLRDDTTLQAVFVRRRCYIRATAEPENAGRVSGETGVRPCGLPSQLKAEPAEGFVFKTWVGPVSDPKSPVTTIVPIKGNRLDISAQFEKKQ
jgi:hypothetical protein